MKSFSNKDENYFKQLMDKISKLINIDSLTLDFFE